MTRTIKPRPAFAVRPSFVSDETSFPVLGLTPRKFRELLVPRCGGHVTRLGHTVLLPLEIAEDALRDMASSVASSDEPKADETQPTTSAAVLALLGRKRVA